MKRNNKLKEFGICAICICIATIIVGVSYLIFTNLGWVGVLSFLTIGIVSIFLPYIGSAVVNKANLILNIIMITLLIKLILG